jgi:hypothetical protein
MDHAQHAQIKQKSTGVSPAVTLWGSFLDCFFPNKLFHNTGALHEDSVY